MTGMKSRLANPTPIALILPNAKTRGGARWNDLAAWEFAKGKDDTEEKVKEFVKDLYNVSQKFNLFCKKDQVARSCPHRTTLNAIHREHCVELLQGVRCLSCL